MAQRKSHRKAKRWPIRGLGSRTPLLRKPLRHKEWQQKGRKEGKQSKDMGSEVNSANMSGSGGPFLAKFLSWIPRCLDDSPFHSFHSVTEPSCSPSLGLWVFSLTFSLLETLIPGSLLGQLWLLTEVSGHSLSQQRDPPWPQVATLTLLYLPQLPLS